ncbi:HAMP domain-containing sensor histidine kinase [Desulfuromonas carbonis]|uniref:sensor histidine kinase n=1 Tax=Desulfuromonas sp. DDH964 TaxID=1823759 RepID=UPI00083580CD|nr:HAMP domain-containing sensor histidine kinase [Desulfuromonas sp. DDH964]
MTLRTRLMGLMLLTSSCLITVLILFYYQSEKALYNEFQRQTTQLAKAIEVGLHGSAAANLGAPEQLQAYLSSLNTRGVREISVISSADRILASTNRESVGKWITEHRKELIFKAELGEPVTGEGQVYNVIVPVASDGQTMGYIHLALNTDDFSVFLRASAIRRILGALIILALGTVMAFFLAGHYTRPIQQMVVAAGEVASGNLEQELPVARRDEIGDLARSFQDMLLRLREDRQLGERLRAAEHQASLGQVARNIAHEIRNPLNFISLSIDHMRDVYCPDDPQGAERYQRMVGNIKGEIQRISRFVENYLEYGRPLELQCRPLAPTALLDELLDLIAARAREQGIEVQRNYGDLPLLQADPDFLRTCLLNIIVNACEAMPEGGGLEVTGKIDGAKVLLEFRDNGCGVAAAEQERIFEPFFTTKEKGLGLGLALTRRLIEEHGGRVDFASSPGIGTTVSVRLPLPGRDA